MSIQRQMLSMEGIDKKAKSHFNDIEVGTSRHDACRLPSARKGGVMSKETGALISRLGWVTDREIEIFAQWIRTNDYEQIMSKIEVTIQTLNDIETAVFEARSGLSS